VFLVSERKNDVSINVVYCTSFFLRMVVHEKYQQHLWKKFLKMLLIFFMYQGKGKGKSISHRPVTDPGDYSKLRPPAYMTIGNM
jgi:hypothetical protein